MSDATKALWASLVRTVVPVVVGAVLSGLAMLNIDIDPELENNLATVLSIAFTGVYYVLVRLFETHISPKFGWLLLFPKAPVVYSPARPKDIPVAVEAATGEIAIAAAAVSDSPKDDDEPEGSGHAGLDLVG